MEHTTKGYQRRPPTMTGTFLWLLWYICTGGKERKSLNVGNPRRAALEHRTYHPTIGRRTNQATAWSPRIICWLNLLCHAGYVERIKGNTSFCQILTNFSYSNLANKLIITSTMLVCYDSTPIINDGIMQQLYDIWGSSGASVMDHPKI
jgi:hypothetical protein